ncbi:MAG: major capsid protein, partial [Prevotella sp.]|nr:major capsid protein [Prevotella sp.]
MAKFDFNSSRYAKFFESKGNQRFLQTYLDTTGILYTNYGWYLTQGSKDPQMTPTAPSGEAAFTIKSRSLEAAPMMNLRAPLGAGMQIDQKGIEFYTASIPSFISQNGMEESAMEREDKVRRFDMFGNDADIVAAWTETVQAMVDSADATMNWMTAQLMTTAKIDYTGISRGIQAPLHKALVPDDNFTKAWGDKAWTDPDALILTQMTLAEDYYRQKWGYGGPLKWQFTRNFFRNVFLKNPEVKEFVYNFRWLNDLATVVNRNDPNANKLVLTPAMFAQAFVDYQGISPIEVVEERERNITNTTDVFVQGWDDKIAVLRPAGDAVMFMHT